MARIETYPFDLAPTVNDYVIGTDGDSLNATKNYKIMTFLDFLGTQYNLNSTDLLFEYDTIVSTAVGNGYVSTNNYADGTILMSGVTNIYVSKITGFGQLVEDVINALGTDTLSIMFADMGDRNNFGIFNVVSAVDVDANTINLTVTATSTLGSIVDGKVMGIRVGIGGLGGSAVSDAVYGVGWNGVTTIGASKNALYDKIELLVTKDTTQTITGNKVFDTTLPVNFNKGVQIGDSTTNDVIGNRITFTDITTPASYQSASLPSISFSGDNMIINRAGGDTEDTNYTLNADNLTAANVQTIQNKSGTLAHLSDIGGTWMDSDVTATVTSGATLTSAISIAIPAGTLAANGDVLEFQYYCTSTGTTNSNALTAQAGVTGSTASTGTNLSAVTGSLYYKIKGNIQRISNTTFNMFMEFSHGFSHVQVGLTAATLSGGDTWTSDAITHVVSIGDTNSNADFTLQSGYIKARSA